ncbi:hypothetical protein GN244_ATG16255 [Phytophthora infestans]|uniref:Uncharacterized protein n=1 Tax=Phytophthora infestans TaxID=4787 RepID=A0A833W7J8_PHYIN|nr:hypothetical protein GN244_ATG16255 [Phytophthora infestans]
MTDWEVDTTTWTAEQAAMRSEELAPANVSCDKSIRAWTARQHDIFFTYIRGDIGLLHTPNFIKETMISEHRAMIDDMHDTNFNFTLTAVLPATIRMTSNTAHAAIFKDVFLANTDDNTGHAMMRAFQKDVKRL